MIRIGIELPDRKLTDVDLSHPEKGNPGVGGSEFLFALLAYFLNKSAKEKFEICVIHYGNTKLPEGIKSRIASDEIELLDICSESGIDILIHQVSKNLEWYEHLRSTAVKSIAWAHIYLVYSEKKYIEGCDNVKRVVFVGREEYDAYIDEDIISKSEWIYNMIDTSGAVKQRRDDYSASVTYIGSLVPAKGFHVLARAWPRIVKKVPDAQLNVIGTGKIYDRGAELGEYQIAQKDYEKSFMTYLTDSNGIILKNVHFWGILGSEKMDIICDTAVGIVNPTALTETFCMSAIEMELCGTPIVSRKKWGLLDTVKHKETGYLFRKERQFISYVVKLLRDRALNKRMSRNARKYVITQFDAEGIILKWNKLIEDVDNDQPPQYDPVKGNYTNDLKWLRIIVRKFRFDYHMPFLPSVMEVKHILKQMLNKGFL